MEKRIATPACALVRNDKENDSAAVQIVPVVGQAVRFDPFGHIQGYGVSDMREQVEGTVETVNVGHRMFTVRYSDPPARTSFNFFDIGKEVFCAPGGSIRKVSDNHGSAGEGCGCCHAAGNVVWAIHSEVQASNSACRAVSEKESAGD